MGSSGGYSSGNSGMSGMNHHSNQMSSMSAGDFARGNSGMSSGDYARGNSGMSHQSNQISGIRSSSGSYASGNSGMSGMNQHSNQMFVSTSGGHYSGSAQRNMHSSTGTGSQRSINMRSSSLGSGSLSVPEIEYSDILDTLEEFSEADQSNYGNNGMQNYGSSSSYGMQNQGSSGSFGMQNRNSAGSFGMQNHGSSVFRILEALVTMECRIMVALAA